MKLSAEAGGHLEFNKTCNMSCRRGARNICRDHQAHPPAREHGGPGGKMGGGQNDCHAGAATPRVRRGMVMGSSGGACGQVGFRGARNQKLRGGMRDAGTAGRGGGGDNPPTGRKLLSENEK